MTPRNSFIPWFALISLAIFIGFLAYAKLGPGLENKHQNQNSITQTDAPETTLKSQVRVPIARAEDDNVKIESEVRDRNAGQDPVVIAVNSFLKETHIAPPDAQLLKTTFEDDHLVLEFNAAFNHTFGTDDERTLLKGILLAVKENSRAKTVSFYADGKEIETLGSVDLTGKTPVDMP
jgi:hypothetical protein